MIVHNKDDKGDQEEGLHRARLTERGTLSREGVRKLMTGAWVSAIPGKDSL